MTDSKPRGACPRKPPKKLTVAQQLAFRMPINPPKLERALPRVEDRMGVKIYG